MLILLAASGSSVSALLFVLGRAAPQTSSGKFRCAMLNTETERVPHSTETKCPWITATKGTLPPKVRDPSSAIGLKDCRTQTDTGEDLSETMSSGHPRTATLRTGPHFSVEARGAPKLPPSS